MPSVNTQQDSGRWWAQTCSVLQMCWHAEAPCVVVNTVVLLAIDVDEWWWYWPSTLRMCGGTVKLRVNNKKRDKKNKPTYAYGWWLSMCVVVVVTVDAVDIKGKKIKEKKTYPGGVGG